MKDKIISVKLKSFTIIGITVIAGSFALCLSVFISPNLPEEYIAATIKAGIIIAAFGILLCYMGTKARKIIFLEDRIEYRTSKLVFSAKYDEINLLKTFKDTNNKSNNLLVLIEENNLLSLSSSFFSLEKIQEAYREITIRCKKYIDSNEVTVENELNW